MLQTYLIGLIIALAISMVVGIALKFLKLSTRNKRIIFTMCLTAMFAPNLLGSALVAVPAPNSLVILQLLQSPEYIKSYATLFVVLWPYLIISVLLTLAVTMPVSFWIFKKELNPKLTSLDIEKSIKRKKDED